MKRILIVEHEAFTREALRKLITRRLGDMEFGEAKGLSEARTALKKEKPWDLVLLDVSVRGNIGLHLLSDIAPVGRTKVLVFSDVPYFGPIAMRFGAAGYICKTASSEQFIRAVEQVLDGKEYISDSLAAQMASDALNPRALPHELLTRREFELMQLLAKGRSFGEAAKDMGVTDNTVMSFWLRSWKKTDLDSITKVSNYANRHSLALVPWRKRSRTGTKGII